MVNKINTILIYSELYLDGNDLGCVGAYNLIVGIVEECEREIIRKELEEKARLEEEEQRLREGKSNFLLEFF